MANINQAPDWRTKSQRGIREVAATQRERAREREGNPEPYSERRKNDNERTIRSSLHGYEEDFYYDVCR